MVMLSGGFGLRDGDFRTEIEELTGLSLPERSSYERNERTS
jgi:hypothetical protein